MKWPIWPQWWQAPHPWPCDLSPQPRGATPELLPAWSPRSEESPDPDPVHGRENRENRPGRRASDPHLARRGQQANGFAIAAAAAHASWKTYPLPLLYLTRFAGIWPQIEGHFLPILQRRPWCPTSGR